MEPTDSKQDGKEYRIYLNKHLKILMDIMTNAYYRLDFLQYNNTKQQIEELRELMNRLDSKQIVDNSTS